MCWRSLAKVDIQKKKKRNKSFYVISAISYNIATILNKHPNKTIFQIIASERKRVLEYELEAWF
jgi:hypothetical protein